MNIDTTHNPPARDTQCFYVSYFPDEPDALHRDVGDGTQFRQDIFVVKATGYEHALEFAFELLQAKHHCPVTIAKVMAKKEVEAVLDLMNRVERGEVPPATMADEDDDTWVKRYLEDDTNDPEDSPSS